MAARTETKSRMTASAITLLCERGVNGVTVDAVLADSGAPRGSVYHHFPGGRTEMVLEAARVSSDYITDFIRSSSSLTPSEFLDGFVAMWTEHLRRSDYRAGCPVAGLVSETSDELQPAVSLAHETLLTWTDLLADGLRRHGRTAAEAKDLATFVVASIEGAIVLCRSQRSDRPLRIVATQIAAILA